MSAHDPQAYEGAAFNFFKELRPDTNDSHLPLFLDNFKSELAEMKALMDAQGYDERKAFEAVFCEPASPEPQPEPQPTKGIPLPSSLPPLATPEELEAEKQRVFLKKANYLEKDTQPFILDFTTAYEPPEYVYNLDGVGFAPLGGLQAVTGLSGNGKTQLVCQLVATALGGSFGRLQYALTDKLKNPRLLLADTEQETSSVVAMKQRICTMIDANPQQQRDDFQILLLREVLTAEERWQLILKACHEMKPNIIFLDGLLDLIDDFNNNVQCQQRIYELMAMATFYQASVWCVLHLNPNGAKLVGHAGSFLERKCTDLFACIKNVNDKTGQVTFEVSQKKARGRDVPTWKFEVLNVTPWGLPQMIDEPHQLTDFDDIDEIRKWLQDGQNLIEWPATVTDLKRLFKECGGVGSSDRQQRDVEAAKNRRFIVEQPREEWATNQKHAKYNLNL